MSDLIRILIADDHYVVRRGLASVLTAHHQMEVVGEAASGREVVALARALQPDVIVMDMMMPELSGSEAIAQIKQDHPEIRILVLTSFSERAQIVAAVQAGATGYMLKEAPAYELLQAIRSVHKYSVWLPPELAQALVAPWSPTPSLAQLTEREIDVLRLLAGGLSNKQIAQQLSISDATVRAHVSSILVKWSVPNRTQAALIARSHLPM